MMAVLGQALLRVQMSDVQGLYTLFGFSACSAKKHGKFGSARTMVRNQR